MTRRQFDWVKLSVCLGAGLILGQPGSPAQEGTPVASPAPVSTPAAEATPAAPDDQEQLLIITQEWSNACLRGDAEYLSRLLADDYVSTDERAETGDKAAEVQRARDRTVHYTVFEPRDLAVHLHGEMAVVTGRTRFKGTVAATGKLIEAEARFTEVFARIQGKWRAVAAHVSQGG